MSTQASSELGAPTHGAGEELVDEVDEHDTVLRVVTRAQVRAGRLRHRCVFLVVRNTSGALLVHRRAAWKDLWPDRWDVAVGGVVASGEAWQDAARRELAEEVGIVDADPVEVDRARYADAEVAEVARIYTVTSDAPLVFADGEVAEARWVRGDEIDAFAASHALVPDSLALVLPLILDGRA